MKRISTFITAFMLLLCTLPLAPSVCASRYIPSLGLSIEFPENYEVVTREMVENGYFTEYQSNEEICNDWQTNHIYANAFVALGQNEIVVTMTELSMSDFSDLSDESLEEVAKQIEAAYPSYGIYISEWDVYRTDDNAFIRMWFPNPLFGDSAWSLQYYTIKNNHAYNFTYHSYYAEISLHHEETMEYVVSTIQFDGSSSFTYTADSGASFTVPEGWVQKEFTEERNYLDAKFLPVSANGSAVFFGCMDLWGELTAEEKMGLSRAVCDQNMFSSDDIKDFLTDAGISVNAVTKESIGDRIYFCANGTYESIVTVKIHVIVHIEDGWMYQFQFTSLENSFTPYILEEFVRTMQYPAIKTTTRTTARTTAAKTTSVTTTTRPTLSDTSSPSNGSPYAGAVIIGIAVAVILVLVLVIRLALRPKKPVPTPSATPVVRFCRYCGKELPEGSAFCPFCGKPLGE